MEKRFPGSNTARDSECSPDLKTFTEWFYDFGDGVSCDDGMTLRPKPPTCRIELECKDCDSPNGWASVVLTIKDVTGFRFQRVRSTFEVLPSGIQFVWQSRLLYVLLDAHLDDGPGLPDLTKNIAYVAGRECELERTDYVDPNDRS